MPRLIHRNPKYRKHRASGQAVVTIAGKDHYLGPWGSKSSKAAYDRLVGEWLANARQAVGAAGDLTVAELIERYWQHVESYYRHADGTETSEVRNHKPPLSIVNRLYGPTLARDFGPLALDAVRNAMIGSNWGRGVINQNIGRIRRMFKWAVAKELIPPSVHQGLTAVAGLRAGRSAAKETEPVRPVADEVVEATLPHLSTVVAAMVRVQRLTGARPGEVCMMRTADIDTSGPTWTYSPATHKTVHHGHQRSIPVGPKAQDVLRPFLKPLNPPAFIFSPKDADAERRERQHAERKTPLHYGNAPGTNRKRHPKKAPLDYWDVSSYRRAIARACQAAGVEHWHPHQLRHSAATEIRRHFGVEAAATILGHRNVSITELYAEKNAQAGRDIAQAIG